MADRRSLLVIAVISMMMAMAIPQGYASVTGYTATTQSTGNIITAEYFTVSTYQNSDFDPENIVYSEPLSNSYVVSDAVFSDAVKVLYSSSGSNYLINSSYTITNENCYMAITNSKGTVNSYSMTLQCTLSETAASVYGNSVSFMYKVADEANYKAITTPTTISSGTAYKISIQMVIDYNSTTVPVDLSADILAVCSETTNGILNQSCSFSVGTASANTGIEDVMDANGLDDPSISCDGRTYNLEDPDPDHSTYGEGTAAVRISNDSNGDGGIGQPGNGGVSLEMELPSNKLFVIAVHYTDHGKTQKLTVKIIADERKIFDQELQLIGSGVKYIYKYDEWEAGVRSTLPTDESQWMNYWGDIRIELSAANGNSHISTDTTLDLVFKQS